MAQITVHGAGIFGLAIAWACLRRGAQVTVVDPNGVAAGSSGGVVGALAPHTPENWNDKKELQFQSLVMAEALWSEVAEVTGQDTGYARLGRLQPLFGDQQVALARARVARAEMHWQGRFTWDVVAADPLVAPAPTGWMIRDSLTARIHPRRATTALAAAIRARGGKITADASEAAGIEIWATGADGLIALSEAVGATVGNGVKGQAALLQCDLGPVPQIFADGLHIVPHGDGTVAIGSTSERNYDDPTRTDDQLDALIDKARVVCPALRDAPVVLRWAGLRPRAKSRAPMLGPHPLIPGAFIANGGFKIGFGMAPICAELMADLVLDGVDRIPDSFRPEASLPAGYTRG